VIVLLGGFGDRINAGDWQFTRLRYLGGTASTPAIHAPVGPETEFSGVQGTFFNPDTGQSERVCRQTLSGAAGRNPEMIESDCRLAAQIDGDGRIARIDGAEGDCVYVDAALRDGTDAPD